MSLRIHIVFVLVSLAGLWTAVAMADENQADLDAVLQRLDAIQDSLEGQNGMFENRFSDLEREIGGLHRLPSVRTISMTQEGDLLADSAPLDDCQCERCSRCPCCCSPTGIEAGVEATFLKLFPPPLNAPAEVSFDTQAAPRIWLGYRYDDRWGVRARYWDYFTEGSSRFSQGIINVGPPGFGQTTSGFIGIAWDACAVDLEVTRRAYFGDWSLLGSMGARYASIGRSVDFNLQNIDLSTDEVMLANQTLGSTRSGVGLTFAVDGKRPFGFWNLSLVFDLRGSVLWGNETSHFNLNSMTLAPDGAGNLIIVSSSSFVGTDSLNSTMWIGEAQLGVDWSQPIESFGGGEIFAQGALEVQSWSAGDPGRENVLFGSTFSVGFTR